MLRCAFAQGRNRAVIPALRQDFATIGFVRNSNRPAERGVGIEIAGSVEVEVFFDEVAPSRLIECPCTSATKDVRPFIEPCTVNILVDRHRVRWEEVVLNLTVLIDVNLWSNRLHQLHFRLSFFLGERDAVAIHVKPVVVVASPKKVDLVGLERAILVVTTGVRVIANRESLVPVGVINRIQDDNCIFKGFGKLTLSCDEVVKQLHP